MVVHPGFGRPCYRVTPRFAGAVAPAMQPEEHLQTIAGKCKKLQPYWSP
jgi:hypothetical protein